MRVEFTGVSSTLKALGRRKATATRATEDVLRQNGEIILKQALVYVPFRTGRLYRSGKVIVTGRGGNAKVRVVFGGPGIAYALYVHENPAVYHKPPTMYKYLERAVAGTKGTRAALVKRVLKTELGGA